MRARLSYFWWKLRGRGVVRLHMPGQPSIEGLLVGCRHGHYLLLEARLLTDNGDSHQLAGSVSVPRERVLFLQEMT